MSKLKDAIVMATLAHGDTVDKSGELYILHPLAVMLDTDLTTEREQICAVLHDVIEDTDVTEHEIYIKFGLQTLEDVQGVSRAYFIKPGFEAYGPAVVYKQPQGPDADVYVKEPYTDFIDRAARTETTKKVKVADLKHNRSPRRMAKLPPEMRDIDKRYKKGLLRLGVSVD